MKTQFVMATIAVALMASNARAALMPRLDIDELLWNADAVVEGSIQKTQTRNYEVTASVKVERTLVGDNLTGRTIGLDVALYSLRQPPYGTEREFGKGDRAIFFLSRRAKHPVGEHPSVGLEIINTGARILRSGRVYEFTQIRNPGGLTENNQNSVLRAVFDAGFAASRKRIHELKAHLKAPARLEDEAYYEGWRVAHPGLAGDALHERLAQIHTLRRLQTRKPRST